MANVAEDPLAILRAIGQDPAALAELRRLASSDELRALAAAQERTEARLTALIDTVTALVGEVRALAARMDSLAAAQERTEEALLQLTSTFAILATRQDRGHRADGRVESPEVA